MKKIKEYTLVFIKRGNSVLLGYKTRGLGVGLWNGFGGKVEQNETVIDAAIRELKEESNLQANSLNQIGVIIYEDGGSDIIALIHVFTTNNTTGTIQPSEEMCPIKWFKWKQLPFEKMWPGTLFWYPLMLKDMFFTTYVKYGIDEKIKDKEIKTFSSLEEVLKNVSKFQ